MEKQIITFSASEQTLTKTGGLGAYSSHKVSYIEAVFALGDNWSGYDSVRAVWSNDYKTISTVLDSTGHCLVPHEVLTARGKVRVNLVGSISVGSVLTDRITSYPVVALVVDAVAKTDGSETAAVTPSQFEQFVAVVKEDADRAEAGATNAEASAQSASGSATASANSATASATSAGEAEQSKTQAQTYAQNAYNSAVSAESAKDDAEDARDEIRSMRAEAVTLPSGSDATASYSDGLLSLGIPKGDKGEKGNTGNPAGFGTVSATVDANHGTPAVTVTASGPDTAKNFAFAFSNLQPVLEDGSITLVKLNTDVKNEYVPRQHKATAPSTQDLYLEKLNDTSLLLEPINLQTIRDCRLLGFRYRSGAKNHNYIERCYFLDDASNPTIDTHVFDFDSESWVGSLKVVGCESYFRKYFITANSKDMTDVYFHLCTIEGAKKFATMQQNAIIRLDSCYIGDQKASQSSDEPYITMTDNSKLIITNSQIGSDSKGGQPFIKCDSGCQVLIKDTNIIMTNQAEPGANRFINYGGVPFDGAVGCDFVLDNVTWNVIPKRVNYNHNSIALACRQDKWRPTSNTPVKNYIKNPFFLDTSAIPSEWVDVTTDSNSPFYGYYNPYGGHIYSCGNTTQAFAFDWEIPEEKIGQNFYFIVFLNAQIGSNTPYFEGRVNCTWETQGIMTGSNNMVAPNSLDGNNIYTPVLNMYGKLKCNAKTGKMGFSRNSSTAYISGVAFVAEEDINKFPIYDNLY